MLPSIGTVLNNFAKLRHFLDIPDVPPWSSGWSLKVMIMTCTSPENWQLELENGKAFRLKRVNISSSKNFMARHFCCWGSTGDRFHYSTISIYITIYSIKKPSASSYIYICICLSVSVGFHAKLPAACWRMLHHSSTKPSAHPGVKRHLGSPSWWNKNPRVFWMIHLYMGAEPKIGVGPFQK